MNLCDNDIIDKNLKYEMRLSLNDDSRKVLKLSNKEQTLFYREISRYSNVINHYTDLMDRKTKVIFNYRLPYPIWQIIMWMYMIKARLKK